MHPRCPRIQAKMLLMRLGLSRGEAEASADVITALEKAERMIDAKEAHWSQVLKNAQSHSSDRDEQQVSDHSCVSLTQETLH